VLGKEIELGNLICKFNAKDQADMHARTAEVIADFVGMRQFDQIDEHFIKLMNMTEAVH